MSFFRCLNCSATEVEIATTRWRCARCGYAYPVEQGIPLLVRDWQGHQAEIAQAKSVKPDWYITQQPPEDVSPWRHHLKKRRSYVEQQIQSYLQRVGSQRVQHLLDLGCGDGNHLAYLGQYSQETYGSDYNLMRLTRAQLRFSQAILFLADILDYPAQEAFFDLIFFNHVIEHIPADETALSTIYRILKPNGLLILGTPNEGVCWWQLAYKLTPGSRAASDHVHFYTIDTLTKKMQAAGFSIVETKHLGWGPPQWTLDSLIRRFRWVDDAFEVVGKVLLPHQASSLYVIATKK